jgi:hypothetical protein
MRNTINLIAVGREVFWELGEDGNDLIADIKGDGNDLIADIKDLTLSTMTISFSTKKLFCRKKFSDKKAF